MSGLGVVIVSRRVHPAHGPGGLERAVHDQVIHLTRAGVEVTLISETPPTARREAAERAFESIARLVWVDGGPLPIGRRPGTVILDRVTNYPIWSLRVAEALPVPIPDIVHAHGLGALGVARLRAAGTLGRPLVLGTHGMEEFVVPDRLKRAAYAPFRAWMRESAAAADRVVVTDEALREVVAGALAVESGRLRVIPNAVDPEACVAAADPVAARRLLGEGDEPALLFVSVGRIAANKGFDSLARALGRVSDRLPAGWRWVLVGDGPERSTVERAAAEAGIGGSVLLAGRVEEPVKQGLLAIADVFVHPTRYEGSSIVTLEAMSHGLAVVATRAGGLPDKVLDGETGLLVDPDDESALAAALVSVVSADREAWGRAGRRLLERRFAWGAIVPRHVELYRELADGCNATG